MHILGNIGRVRKKKRCILLFSFFGFVFSSCDDRVPATEPSNQMTVQDTVVELSEKDDTIRSVSSLPFVTPKLEQKNTVLQIDNESYTLSYTTQIDTSQKIEWTETYTHNGKNYKDTYKGYNANFSIILKNNSKDSLTFSTLFTKEIFKEITDNDILSQSKAYLPFFIGYIPTFKSFLFTIEFWIPDSDVGSEIFFMLNKQGGFTENFTNNYYGGGDCDGKIEIPKNQDFILTCRKIVNANNQTIDISNRTNCQIGTKLINDHTILVIQEYNDTNNIENARLINNFGKTLKSFSYNGYYNILGYEVPMHYDTLTKNFVLLDKEQQNIRVINKLNPLLTHIVYFDEMGHYDGKKTENEIVFDLNTEFSKNTFSINKVSHKFRYRLNK